MKARQDKQPRRASKDVPLEQLHPASDMGKRAKGGDKFSNPGMPGDKMKDSEQGPTTTPTKPAR